MSWKLLPLLLLLPPAVRAQRDSLPANLPPQIGEIVEDLIRNQDAEGEFDYNAIFEELEIYRQNPLDLNRATEDELRELRLLTDHQILDLLRYRTAAGDLVSIYELQAIPSFDLPTIRRVLPFVRVGGELDDYRVALPRLITAGKNELFLRWSRILERQKGYLPPAPGSTAARYLGDPHQLYLRFRHTYSNRLSFGFTAEKDRGEEFFRGSNRHGFDYFSAHLFLRDYNRTLRALALGDFSVSFGQGLVLFQGFSYGSAAASIKRSGRTVSPYASAGEATFMRGAAATLGLGRHWELTTFASRRRRDGNLSPVDTLPDGDLAQSFSSLGLSGLHRTPNEIADKNALGHFTTGGSLRYRRGNNHLAANLLYDRFDRPLERREQPYSRYYFQGRQALNASLDYSFVFRNLNLFGETARGANGRLATLHGLLLGLDRRADLALLFRHYPRDYVALNASPFGETGGGRNETGLYLGLALRPATGWTLDASFDAWRHPWLRFNADAPSRGHEWRARLTYERRRSLRAYLEARDETRELNGPPGEGGLHRLLPHRRFSTRLHLAPQLTRSLELRARFDWGFAHNPAEGYRYGNALLLDLLYRPMAGPLSFTTRFAVFDTDGYDVRFYHYENNLLYAASVPAYYNRGSRFYFNLRYRPVQALTLELRFAQTFWANQGKIGSGLEEIEGPVRSQVGAQVKYQFSRG